MLQLYSKETTFVDQEHWKREVIKQHELVVFRAIANNKTLLGWRALTPVEHKEIARYNVLSRKGTIN
jgi:hypothetical protein